MSTEENKTKRIRRSKADIEKCIVKAAKDLVLMKGFSKVSVLDIIKRAKIEPITFYSRYRNQEKFYEYFVREYDYWFTDIINTEDINERSENAYVSILTSLLHELSKDSVMLELLRWEISEINNTTMRTAMNRELHTLPLVSQYETDFKDSDIDISAISSLLIGGIYYLCLHKGCSTFCRIDLKTQEGIQKIQNALRSIGHILYERQKNATSENKDKLELIAERMKLKGMSSEDIEYCLMK